MAAMCVVEVWRDLIEKYDKNNNEKATESVVPKGRGRGKGRARHFIDVSPDPSLNEGISDTELQTISEKLEYPLPQSLIELYKLANGQRTVRDNSPKVGLFGDRISFRCLKDAVSGDFLDCTETFFEEWDENLMDNSEIEKLNEAERKNENSESTEEIRQARLENNLTNLVYKDTLFLGVCYKEEGSYGYALMFFTTSEGEWVHEVCYWTIQGHEFVPFGLGEDRAKLLCPDGFTSSLRYATPSPNKFDQWLDSLAVALRENEEMFISPQTHSEEWLHLNPQNFSTIFHIRSLPRSTSVPKSARKVVKCFESSVVERVFEIWKEVEEKKGSVLNQGATETEIETVEKALGFSLPPSLKELYQHANGQKEDKFELWGNTLTFLPISEALEYAERMEDTSDALGNVTDDTEAEKINQADKAEENWKGEPEMVNTDKAEESPNSSLSEVTIGSKRKREEDDGKDSKKRKILKFRAIERTREEIRKARLQNNLKDLEPSGYLFIGVTLDCEDSCAFIVAFFKKPDGEIVHDVYYWTLQGPSLLPFGLGVTNMRELVPKNESFDFLYHHSTPSPHRFEEWLAAYVREYEANQELYYNPPQGLLCNTLLPFSPKKVERHYIQFHVKFPIQNRAKSANALAE